MNAARAVGAGAIATASMTALLLIEPAVGLPEIAIGQLLSSSLSFTTAVLSAGPALGWLLHFLVGIAWGLLYAGVVLDRLPGMSGGYFDTRGTTDATLYGSGSPNTNGFIGEVDLNPWENTRVGLQYTGYSKFDGTGTNASGNNTLFAFLWMAF